MRFTKMHGCGNDFMVVDGPVELSAARVRELCDRRRGIGADGILVIGTARGRCWPVMIHNADGSPGESCGNGARCVARYLLACGTGACATVAAAACEQSMAERVTVRVRGGDLFVRAGARTFELAGPPECVFQGTT